YGGGLWPRLARDRGHRDVGVPEGFLHDGQRRPAPSMLWLAWACRSQWAEKPARRPAATAASLSMTLLARGVRWPPAQGHGNTGRASPASARSHVPTASGSRTWRGLLPLPKT